MNKQLREDANRIIDGAIRAVCPDEAVRRALENIEFTGRVYIVSIGKAGWQMAKAAVNRLGEKNVEYTAGVVVTKYDHVQGELRDIECFEGGHPVPDANGFMGTQAAIDMVSDLKEEDTVLFLISGGGSALFEKPLIDGDELAEITNQLLKSGADIVEMNTVRKRLSAVKGGRFALICAPARVEAIVLSDIVGDPLDMIASGPAYPDTSTSQDALFIAKKYNLDMSESTLELLAEETPKELKNVNTQIIGSVRELCKAAAVECEKMGYEPVMLDMNLTCEADAAGQMLVSKVKENLDSWKKLAFIAGGETVVHIKGDGLGGRNQQLAFSTMRDIAGEKDVAIFAVGSDGTDGPTDAAGGYVDGESYESLKQAGLDYNVIMDNNDCYNGLKAIDGLVITGPTGTNVNDFCVALIS
ncbi:MAG: glycerate kinase [Lachnospiraceae bacterium]|nr:glycerate kinase [Lachnospiraceae bacterium]